MPQKLQDRCWAVFVPSGSVSYRSFEHSREASIAAFCGAHWAELWPSHEAAGFRCVELELKPRPKA